METVTWLEAPAWVSTALKHQLAAKPGASAAPAPHHAQPAEGHGAQRDAHLVEGPWTPTSSSSSEPLSSLSDLGATSYLEKNQHLNAKSSGNQQDSLSLANCCGTQMPAESP
jgi:hypothetical protein